MKDEQNLTAPVSELQDGDEEYFMQTATFIMEMAVEYGRDVSELHKLFYQCNCKKDQLEKLLKGQKIVLWTPLEDLALKDS